MLAAPSEQFDPTFPGLFAGNPPAEFVPLLEEIAAAVRPESLRTQLFVMAEADQRDLLPRIAVPTLLIWGERDARSPLSVARQSEHAIADTRGRSPAGWLPEHQAAPDEHEEPVVFVPPTEAESTAASLRGAVLDI
jgi:pimeloyl-ACP methyl ester carboxylesterase